MQDDSQTTAPSEAPLETDAPEVAPDPPALPRDDSRYTRDEVLDAAASYGVDRHLLAAALHTLGRPATVTRAEVEQALAEIDQEDLTHGG